MAVLCDCRILVPQPEIEPGPSAVKMQSPNQWTCRGFPRLSELLIIHFLWTWTCNSLIRNAKLGKTFLTYDGWVSPEATSPLIQCIGPSTLLRLTIHYSNISEISLLLMTQNKYLKELTSFWFPLAYIQSPHLQILHTSQILFSQICTWPFINMSLSYLCGVCFTHQSSHLVA